jgi:toxin ParE1/3/4
MGRFRLSPLAEADLAHILATSEERWGTAARRRYAALLAAAMRKAAADPDGPTTRNRRELSPGLRSFHARHARHEDPKAKVRRPVQVLYYRAVASDLIEVVRVLHERVEPSRHLGSGSEGND